MSYSEIKHALNSTVGTQEFKPLDQMVGDIKERLEDPMGDYHIFALRIPGGSVTKILNMPMGTKIRDLNSINNKEKVVLDVEKSGILFSSSNITLVAQSYLYYFCSRVRGYLIYDFGYGEIKKEFDYTISSPNASTSISHVYIRLPETSYFDLTLGLNFAPTNVSNYTDRIVLPYPIQIKRFKVKYKVIFEGIKSSSSYNPYLDQIGIHLNIGSTNGNHPAFTILGRE